MKSSSNVFGNVVLSLLATCGIFVLVLTLGMTVLNPGTLTGPSTVAMNLFIIILPPALICIWSSALIDTSARWFSWLMASLAGVFAYYGIEFIGTLLFLGGQSGVGLSMGFMSDVFAAVGSIALVKYFIKRRISTVKTIEGNKQL